MTTAIQVYKPAIVPFAGNAARAAGAAAAGGTLGGVLGAAGNLGAAVLGFTQTPLGMVIQRGEAYIKAGQLRGLLGQEGHEKGSGFLMSLFPNWYAAFNVDKMTNLGQPREESLLEKAVKAPLKLLFPRKYTAFQLAAARSEYEGQVTGQKPKVSLGSWLGILFAPQEYSLIEMNRLKKNVKTYHRQQALLKEKEQQAAAEKAASTAATQNTGGGTLRILQTAGILSAAHAASQANAHAGQASTSTSGNQVVFQPGTFTINTNSQNPFSAKFTTYGEIAS